MAGVCTGLPGLRRRQPAVADLGSLRVLWPLLRADRGSGAGADRRSGPRETPGLSLRPVPLLHRDRRAAQQPPHGLPLPALRSRAGLHFRSGSCRPLSSPVAYLPPPLVPSPSNERVSKSKLPLAPRVPLPFCATPLGL